FNSGEVVRESVDGSIILTIPLLYKEDIFSVLSLSVSDKFDDYSFKLLMKYLPQFSFYLRFILSFEFMNVQHRNLKKKYDNAVKLLPAAKLQNYDFAVKQVRNDLRLKIFKILDTEFISSIEYIKSQIYSSQKYFSKISSFVDDITGQISEKEMLLKIENLKNDTELFDFFNNVDSFLNVTVDELMHLLQFINVLDYIEKRRNISYFNEIIDVLAFIFHWNDSVKIVKINKRKKLKNGYLLLLILYLSVKIITGSTRKSSVIKFDFEKGEIRIESTEEKCLHRFLKKLYSEKAVKKKDVSLIKTLLARNKLEFIIEDIGGFALLRINVS
ncbi:MAG: hypothetical protein KAS39_01785, partial [Actinomycetia bacterium]|nr:hypothetical protein [Actinomycetes bacterium]